MVKTNIQTFTGDVEVLEEFHVGSNLVANDTASNVLTVVGSIGANTFIGDGGLLSNIATTLGKIVDQGNTVANVVQFSSNTGYGGVGIVTTSNVGIQNTNPLHTLSIGDKVYFDSNTNEALGQSVMVVDGRINATRFEGDGGLLSNIATTLDQIVDQGNTVSNTVIIVSGQDTTSTSNIGLITHENVGISVSNAEPSSAFQLTVGDALFVNTYGSNVLTVQGNAAVSNLLVTEFTVSPAHNLQHVTQSGSASDQTIQLTNATTGLEVSSNATVGGNVTAESVISTANVEVGNRLKFSGSNVFVDTLRVADVAANIVTYDRTTGELLDSSGTFMNKFAVVSEQPPSNFFANTTTVANHGTYTLTTSNLATDSNTFNAFDGTANAWVSGDGYIGGSNVFHETNLTQLSNLHPTQFGDWLAIEFPYKTTLRHMKLTPLSAAQFPASANLYATNNDLTWSEIKYWKDVNPVTSSNVQTIVVNATEQFKKYALVATKAAGNSANVAIQDWQLFTESFSIDGGKVAMASSAVMGGETTVEQSGPHSRLPKAMPLRKYPEIAFDASKLDGNDTTNTYTQAGYTVSASSQGISTNTSNFRPWNAFNGLDKLAAKNDFWLMGIGTDVYTGTGTTGIDGDADENATLFNSRRGEWIQLETPNKVKIDKFIIKSRTYDGISPRDHPKSGYLYASNNGTDWEEIKSFTNLVYIGTPAATSGPIIQSYGTVSVDVNSTDYYRYFRLQVTQRVANTYWNGSANADITWLSLGELEYYGYEEDPPAGDTSVDTTFTSIMNTPQTTGANVYVDGSLGETFTNRVTGPTPTGTATTYNASGKYWELTGALTSNVTLEANTFLEGDAPHSVSVWFNSSNLEANTANTCVFSISDQEKLDSVNLDLQSNTWHNLTYAYQGEGGSRVTYLDGRKVAEDQAEDTFGDYPPFAMTGYSQGGYVVSASSEYSPSSRAWEAFDPTTTQIWICDDYNSDGITPRYTGGLTSSGGGVYQGPISTDSIPISGSGSETIRGEYIQIEFPFKFKLEDIAYLREASFWGHIRLPYSGSIVACNDGINWKTIHNWTGLTDADVGSADGSNLAVTQSPFRSGIFAVDKDSATYDAYKFFRIICTRIQKTYITQGDGNSFGLWSIAQLELYGHRENDLVRLPDPTRVLKYPHIAMTGPAQRGYVASASSNFDTYNPWEAFDNNTGGGWISVGGTNYSGGSGEYNKSPGSLLGTISGTSTEIREGEFLQIETPHKIMVNHILLSSGSSDGPTDFKFWGSNDGSVWSLLHTEINHTNATSAQVDINSSVAYKYHAIVISKTRRTTLGDYVNVRELELYGTGVDSVPIQIGGGNIDKVANFRVYDKFIGEDQALEIWDSQKDVFREVKNSMTLHKGRLGIGTTEPEGRLAVLDEPTRTFEPRWPPKPLVGYNTYIEGYGEFVVHRSPNESGGEYRGNSWWIFDDSQNTHNFTYHGERVAGTNDSYFGGVNGVYDGNNSIGGIPGDWTVLESPIPIKINDIIRMRVRSSGQNTRGFIIAATNDLAGTWTKLTEQSNLVWQTGGLGESKTFHFANDTYYKYYAIIITQALSTNGYPTLSNMEFSGTVQRQGQSVLHDGQLTLTKNLTVPRIGPALDADNTPRRDRLVVEYNTSTNPTFEGAVRDTSGRGNDGILVGNVSYNAMEKIFDIAGTPNGQNAPATSAYLEVGQRLPFKGNQALTVSLWFKKVNAGQNYTLVNMWKEGTNYTTSGDSLGVLVLTTGKFLFWTFGGEIYYTDPLGDAFDGGWRHIVAVYTGTTLADQKIYVNGIAAVDGTPVSTGTSQTRDLTNAKMTIGKDHYRGDFYNQANTEFAGIKVYDCALTAQEVKTLYDMGRCDEGHHVVNFSKTRVGIGLGDGETPRDELDVRGNVRGSENVIVGPPGGQWWRLYTFQYNGNLGFIGEDGTEHGYLIDSGTVQNIDFTGQHRAVVDKVNVSDYENLEGLIVSANKNKYINVDKDITTGSNAIQISQSLPVVSLSNVVHDKACYGVIAGSEDPESRTYEQGTFVSVFQKQKGDTRAFINSVGEGAIWVVNTNGPLESGDYITTSNVAGYGQKQDDDVLHNYTVAKITMDCDFNPATQPVQQILRSNVVETYYLGNVHKVKNVPHEFVTTVVGADDEWSNVSVSPSDVTYAEWSNLEANTQNTYTLTYTQTSNVVYDTKYTLTTTANVTESDSWDRVYIDPPTVTYAEYSNLEANTQNTYTLTFTQTTTDTKTPEEWSALESNTQSLYNKVYYQSVEEEVAPEYPGAVAHTRVTDVIENELDEHGQIQWEDHPTETEKAYKIRFLDASGAQTDEANAVHIAAFVGCTYHCG